MASRNTTAVIAWLATIAIFLFSPLAHSAENIRQYRAALTKIFLWRYRALPIFRLNPLFPGDVVQLNNETKYLSHERCYKNLGGGRYRGIQDYQDGMEITTALDLRINGELLHERIAEVDAAGSAKFNNTAAITVSPLSADAAWPDSSALQKITSDDACKIILDILHGQQGGYAVTDTVLHGRVNVLLTTKASVALSAQARGDLLKKISKVFGVTEAAIKLSGDTASFAVAESPDNMTLAMVPARFSVEELARITQYLQGKRGADLEIAVQQALVAGDIGALDKLQIQIRSVLGDEIKNREHWAENFLRGKIMLTAAELEKFGSEKVDFAKVSNYAAAMELVRDEAPSRNR